MSVNIPEGDAFLPGRGREEAIAALKAAEDAGLPPEVVRTVQGGYLVPEAVVEHYSGPASPETNEPAPTGETSDEDAPSAEVTGSGERGQEEPGDTPAGLPGNVEQGHGDADNTALVDGQAGAAGIAAAEDPATGEGSSVEEGSAALPTRLPEEGEEVAVKQPAKSAGKGQWVEFAVSQGADREEAEAQTKDQLIEQYGSSE